MTRADLKKAVTEALEKLFEDCSVPIAEVRNDLTAIKEEIDSMVESIEDE